MDIHSESILTEDAEEALLSARAARNEAEEETNHVFSALKHARAKLEEWDARYASHHPPEGAIDEGPSEEPQVCPTTPPVESTIPSALLPPPRSRSFVEPRSRGEEGGMDVLNFSLLTTCGSNVACSDRPACPNNAQPQLENAGKLSSIVCCSISSAYSACYPDARCAEITGASRT